MGSLEVRTGSMEGTVGDVTCQANSLVDLDGVKTGDVAVGWLADMDH